MRRYLLDSSALLALRDDEEGAEKVAVLLKRGGEKKAECLACFITLMEVFYRVWRDEGEAAGRLACEQCRSLPVQWIHEDKALLEKAAEIKATSRLSLADAWIAASAILKEAVLVHKDPEYTALDLPQLSLSHKE